MTEYLYYLLLGLGAAFCAYRAMISKHLLPSTLYLACVSALASITLYLLGAQEVAVIELSVGAGLVTVLLVYVLSVVGDDNLDPTSIIPKPLAFVLVATITILVTWMAFPLITSPSTSKVHLSTGSPLMRTQRSPGCTARSDAGVSGMTVSTRQ